MEKRFENRKLNKEDHEIVDKEAKAARDVAEGIGLLAVAGVVLKFVPWRKIVGAAEKVIFRL